MNTSKRDLTELMHVFTRPCASSARDDHAVEWHRALARLGRFATVSSKTVQPPFVPHCLKEEQCTSTLLKWLTFENYLLQG